jgi:hypothetical protein
MATLVDTLPKNDDGRIIFNPAGEMNNTFIAGSVGVEWFKNVFTDLANATASPLTQTNYEALKAIDMFWKINAINWRKNGVIAVYNTPADKIIDEEEAFLLEMYPPPAEEEQPTTEENTTEGA